MTRKELAMLAIVLIGGAGLAAVVISALSGWALDPGATAAVLVGSILAALAVGYVVGKVRATADKDAETAYSDAILMLEAAKSTGLIGSCYTKAMYEKDLMLDQMIHALKVKRGLLK